jgi:hypothetical protein
MGRSPGVGGGVGYNVQTAVDVEHHLIVAHEVTNVGHDRTQLVPMALRAQEATGNKEITVLADRGYFNGDQVLACENTGVLPCVPKTLTSSSAKRGLFSRQDFVYDAEKDHYLTRGLVRSDRRSDIDQYRHLTARIGSLKVEPSPPCRVYQPPTDKIAPVDWIALASLRVSLTLTNTDPSDRTIGRSAYGQLGVLSSADGHQIFD